MSASLPVEVVSRAVLFDLDGVLVDSEAKIALHWSRWALRNGVAPERAVEASRGRSSVQTVALLAPHLDPVAEAERIEAEQGLDSDGMQPIPGAAELVSALPDGSWAVVTSGKRPTALARLAFGGIPAPAVLVTASEVHNNKPEPHGFLLAARLLGAEPEACVVIEDSLVGIQAAHAAGMRVIAVAKSYPPHMLKAADWIARAITDIRITLDAGSGGLRIQITPAAPDV